MEETVAKTAAMKIERTKKKSKWNYIKKNKSLYILLIPGLVLTLVFKYFPMYGTLLAFKDYNPMKGIMGSAWVGMRHFESFIHSPNFSILLWNTVKLSAYGLILGFLPPIILALALNQLMNKKMKKRIQLILYAPNFISGVVIVGMIFIFLSASGPINQIIGSLTGKNFMFMSNPDYFRSIYILSGIWQGMGWSSILYTATLANVSPDLIDAATIDGANIFQKIKNIDLPALKPVMVITFILAAGNIMNVGYEKAFLMQTSMNLPASEIISTYVYKVGLQSGDYAYSTAVGLFNSVINIILLFAVNNIVKHINDGKGL